MRIESNNLIDYFVVCGLNIKSRLEPNESYGKFFKFNYEFFLIQFPFLFLIRGKYYL